MLEVGDMVILKRINGTYSNEIFEILEIKKTDAGNVFYKIQSTSTGAVMAQVNQIIVKKYEESYGERQVDFLLDKYADYMQLYEMFGDSDYKIKAEEYADMLVNLMESRGQP